MTSPARRHFQRVTAAQSAGGAEAGQQQSGDQYELMMATLYDARISLKKVKSTEAKIAMKRELLPQFDAYIEGVLDAGNGARDEVVTTVMIWRLDVGDLEGALAIARYAIEHDLDTPDRFERDTASLVAEQLAEEVLNQIESVDDETRQQLGTRLAGILSDARDLIDGVDMHDQITAKFHKAYGYVLRDAGCPVAAVEQLKRALELNDRVGVKRDIENLERQIKKNASDQPSG